MKKILTIFCLLFCFVHFSAHAEDTFSSELIEKFQLNTISNVSKLIVVDTTLPKARAYILKRFNNSWICLKETPAEIGANGARTNKIQGDKATPKGIYDFVITIGIQDKPDCLLPYYQIKKGDVWVTDPQSKYYNRFVRNNTVFVDWNSQIDLDKRPIRYAYAFVVDYNITHPQPYIGSAFFVHCSNGQPTEGSVALPRSVIEYLLTFIDKETKIYIY